MDEKVAVITGAANGIGLALTKVCLERNFQVVMLDKANDSLSLAVSTLNDYKNRILPIVCDVTQSNELQKAAEAIFAKFNRIDWLINNAGISGRLAPIWEQTDEEIQQVMNVNLYGVIHGIKAFFPWLSKQTHSSHIINMSSLYGLCSSSHLTTYAMSKHALVALSESLFFECKRLHLPIKISLVCPSFTQTSLLKNSAPTDEKNLNVLFQELIERSRPSEELARYIVQEIEKNTFYILPDKEVKNYCEERLKAILNETEPPVLGIEKIITSMIKRNSSIR